eukprot:Em0002g42a
MSGAAIAPGGTQDPESEFGHDQVKVFSHEGDDVENTEHLNSMDLHDVKTELEKDAEKAETRVIGSAVATVSQQTSNVSTVQHANIRPFIPQMVYTNGPMPFMMPQFPPGTPIYHVPAPGTLRPIKVEGSPNWPKAAPGIYGYPAGFFPVDQSTLRPAYPFMIPGQYVAASMPYQQQIAGLGTPVAPNAAVQPNSGLVTPQVKDKRPHIKKPLNAFMLFMKEKRAEVIKECTLKESAAINQILGKMWHALDRTEQAKYYEMAREERARHMQMYPGWSARDNYAVHKKRKKRKIKQVQQEEQEDHEELDPEQSADDDPNARKCRARYGMEQQNLWCGPCRRKKKCIKYSEEDDGHCEDTSSLEKTKELDADVFSPCEPPPLKQQHISTPDGPLCKDNVSSAAATS